MAQAPQRIWKLAHHLHAYVQMEQNRRLATHLPAPAGGKSDPGQNRSGVPGQHLRQGSPGWDRRFKKTGPQAIGKSRGGFTTKIHLVAASDEIALTFALSPGNAHDAPQGRELLASHHWKEEPKHVLMDRAYADRKTRKTVEDLGMVPVVPPKSNMRQPWAYDKELYKKRNEVERLFRRLKGFRRVFTRFDKLDFMFLGFLLIALCYFSLKCVNTP